MPTCDPFVSSVFAIDHDVKVEILEEALARVAAHHEALRLHLAERAGVWEQRIADPEPVPLPVVPIEPGTNPHAALPEILSGIATSQGVLHCAVLDGGPTGTW